MHDNESIRPTSAGLLPSPDARFSPSGSLRSRPQGLQIAPVQSVPAAAAAATGEILSAWTHRRPFTAGRSTTENDNEEEEKRIQVIESIAVALQTSRRRTEGNDRPARKVSTRTTSLHDEGGREGDTDVARILTAPGKSRARYRIEWNYVRRVAVRYESRKESSAEESLPEQT
ncbi:hypothetical protein CPLU01_08630 [Colletotrichum plurivorum]|uniref:Uncharacterized protein n=1 Tax=Colletotrichum plurivorum TaxID=2175906 RepID=A0A8H6NCA1_9PEZI|nr:hypothetical protein CPLU01_08630 [Colletotrichum plurivorum]